MKHSHTRWVFTFLIFGLFVLPGFLRANEIDAHFTRGNEYYQNGNFQAAIIEYQQILDRGYESWQVYFNLGNAYFKRHELGNAILNYERARKLDPENEDVNFNLELANLSVVDRVPEMPQFFVFAWISDFIHLLNLKTLAILTLALYLVFMAFLIAKIIVNSGRGRRLFFTAIFLSGIVFAVFAGTLAVRVYQNETKVEAILLASKVDVKSAPSSDGTDLFTIHEGVKFEIKDHSGDWLEIRLADGKIGWLKQEAAEVI